MNEIREMLQFLLPSLPVVSPNPFVNMEEH